jgi:group I intron endonuclease
MDKSELKKAYKRTHRPMGVYRIHSAQNNTVYIGYSTDVHARINRHRAELKFGNHRNRQLQEAWNDLGESAFQFDVLDELEPEDDSRSDPVEELQVLEELWIRKLDKTGYTIVEL